MTYNLNKLESYMLTNDNILNIIKLNNIEQKINHIQKDKKPDKKPDKKTDKNFYQVNEKDSLFWCYYIIKNGLINYESLLRNTFKEEKDTKINLIEVVRNNKDVLKKNKWKRNEIEKELVSEVKISETTFLCLCKLGNLNIAMVSNNIIYIDEVNSNSSLNIIVKNKDSYDLCLLNENDKGSLLENFKNKFLLVANIKKPLLALSGYKLKELQDIANKLDISIVGENDKRLRKNDLYEKIRISIL